LDPTQELQEAKSFFEQTYLGVPVWVGFAVSLGFMVAFRLAKGRWPVLRLFESRSRKKSRRSRRRGR
jgi:hypothetical protein